MQIWFKAVKRVRIYDNPYPNIIQKVRYQEFYFFPFCRHFKSVQKVFSSSFINFEMEIFVFDILKIGTYGTATFYIYFLMNMMGVLFI